MRANGCVKVTLFKTATPLLDPHYILLNKHVLMKDLVGDVIYKLNNPVDYSTRTLTSDLADLWLSGFQT